MDIKQMHQDEIEIIISNSTKPKFFNKFNLSLNNLNDRVFEIFTYSIFKKRIQVEKTYQNRYDNITLMQGVGEKGMDCILSKNGKIASVIQCKKYRVNLPDKLILSELIKFTLHAILDSTKFNFSNDFTYFLATSTGFTGKSNLLPNAIKDGSFIKDYEFEKITTEIIDKYEEFKHVNFEDIEKKLIKTIQSYSIELIKPEDFLLWVNDYPVLIETFFETKKVTDNKLIEQKSKEIIDTLKDLFSSKEANEVKGFIENYKKVAIEKLNVVNFIGYDIQKHRERPDDITLTELFVQPSFRQRSNEFHLKIKLFNSVSRELKIPNLFNSEKNIIILGDPGAGKSLLVKFLMVNLLNNQSEKIGIRHLAGHLPLRIELRKYNEAGDSKNIVDYLSDILTNDFQTKISSSQLEKILEHSNTIIFFDGLDEIFNIAHKAKVKGAIETFSSRYPNAKCVVTSRFIGYHDIKFNPKKFDEFGILKLSNYQIKELVAKFYSAQNGTLEKKKKSIDDCVKQLTSDVDEELKSNPLILTLILILTYNNIVIPDSKLEIYESCTKTLVDSIDLKEKEMRYELPIKNKNLTFSLLAYWQYESTSKNNEITYPKAIKTIADFLISRKEVTDFNEAESKAEKFLEYAERRSIYFENNFTHKTFLEYFTAEYMYSTCIAKASDEGRRKLISDITKFLPNSFWYIVFELLLTRIDRVQPDNDLLDEIFKKQLESTSLDVFYFLISNLNKFINVSIDVKKSIITKTILLCIKGEKMKSVIRREMHFQEYSILYKLSVLLNNEESKQLLQDVIYEFENDGLTEKQEIELYNFYFEISTIENKKLLIKNKNKLRQLANKDILLYSNLYLSRKGREEKEKINVEILINQIENFGIKSLFKYIPYRYIENSQRIDTFDLYLLEILEDGNFNKFKNDLEKLSEHGLKSELILEHVNDTRLLFFTRSHALEKILNLYLQSNDELVDEILTRMIRKDKDMITAYEKFKTSNSNSKLKNIDKIFETQSRLRFKTE